MEQIELEEAGLRIAIRINEDRTAELVDASAQAAEGKGEENLPLLPGHGAGDRGPSRAHQLVSLQVTGESSLDLHGNKHDSGSESCALRYLRHTVEKTENGRELKLFLESPHELLVIYHLQLFAGIPCVRCYSEIRNTAKEEIGIDFAGSFFFGGLSKNGRLPWYEKTRILVPNNSWSAEAQWSSFDCRELGLSHLAVRGYNLPDRSNSVFHYGSTGSWSTSEHLPMGMSENTETGEVSFFEIETSASWEIEYGSEVGENLYVCLLGPDDLTGFWKKLRPGETFATVPAAFGCVKGSVSDAISALTDYRRRIRRENADDAKPAVIFNDYMNCLFGDPTSERERKAIDRAASLGCEIYCMDCGWYDSGAWWDRVGEWRESRERFPDGMKAVCDYAVSKGMRMGLWLEIEVMGTACALSHTLPDDWFFCLHGKRRIDNKRYLLDFRNPDVRAYCTEMVERLIRDYGISYFKIDYNVTTGIGSDLEADSPGEALLAHYRAYYDWIRALYARHPDLVIENCGSGGQRMDYGLLSLHSLQSTSDQTDAVSNAHIASNVASAVTPEQAGMWVYPYEDDREHVIWNMANGMLLRPYISGRVWDLGAPQRELLRQGIACYKDIREDLTKMRPFWPLGFSTVRSGAYAYGLRDEEKAYLTVWCEKQMTADLDLSMLPEIRKVRVLYPETEDCQFDVKNTRLHVKMPKVPCARVFALSFV